MALNGADQTYNSTQLGQQNNAGEIATSTVLWKEQ